MSGLTCGSTLKITYFCTNSSFVGFSYPGPCGVSHRTSSICKYNPSHFHSPVHSIRCFSLCPVFSMQQVISVWVRDPRIQKNDFWHAYIDYEICLHVSKMFRRAAQISVHSTREACCDMCVTLGCPVLDRQRLLHQEDLAREKEIQRVCVAQAKIAGKFIADVSSFTAI